MAPRVGYPTYGLLDRLGYPKESNLLIAGSFEHDDWVDSFKGDQLEAEYPAAKTNGTSAARTFTEHNANGFLELVSGTADDGYAGTGFGLNWTGDRGVLFQAIIQTPAAITTWKFEVGVSDADDDAGAVNQKATTTTATAADFAVFIHDSDDDANFGFVSAKAGTVTATQDIRALAVNTTYSLAVRVNGDNIIAYINGTVVATHGGGIEGGNGITPWAFSQARAGSASRTLKLHKWGMNQPSY
jgi:hypothetical protein